MPTCLRLYLTACTTGLTLLCAAAPAHAQFKPQSIGAPATGEQFKIEVTAAYWYPTAEGSIASTSLNVLGSDISLTDDLGLADDRVPAVKVVLRPGRKHKIRLQYTPISYSQTVTSTRTLTFGGQTFTRGVTVASTLDWKAAAVGYEYDFISTNYVFVGGILEAKYSDVSATLTSALASGAESVKAPIPAIGGIVRAYVVPNLSLTGEVTGIKVPSIRSFSGHYADVDVYATLNLSKNVGVQAGYRSLDVQFTASDDSGAMTLKGGYVGGVLRF